MTVLTIRDIALQLNARAQAYEIGRLPALRSSLKNRKRLPSKIFTAHTIFDDYAFHHGGRQELQFNIGWEVFAGKRFLRYGVAFSLELSINLRTIDPLVPKIERFNEFLRLYGTDYGDFRMWQYSGKERSQVSTPAMIPGESVQRGVFIVMGKMQSVDALDYDLMLRDLDRLLPLYMFVESEVAILFPTLDSRRGFQFKEGHTSKLVATTMNPSRKEIDVVLRQNELQDILFEILKRRGLKVGTENPSGNGGKIDAVAKLKNGVFWFYEIKIASSARACIREALAQLLEYAHWPGGEIAERLYIIGESDPDHEAIQYLGALHKRFKLPVYYQKLDAEKRVLSPSVPFAIDQN
jgi:hypothetical protein